MSTWPHGSGGGCIPGRSRCLGPAVFTKDRQLRTPVATLSGVSTRNRRQSAIAGAEMLQTAMADGRLDELCQHHDVGVLVLFGSAAADIPTPGDLDLAYLPGEATDALALLDDLIVLTAEDRIDLVNLATADPSISHRAMAGRPLYEREPGRVARPRDVATRRYLDTAWIRRVQAEVLAR